MDQPRSRAAGRYLSHMGLRTWLIIVAALLAAALGGPLTATAAAGVDLHFDVGRTGDRYVLRGPVDLKAGRSRGASSSGTGR